MKKRLLVVAVLLGLLFVMASPVLADDDTPLMGPGEYAQYLWEKAQTDVIVSIERGFCQILWAFDRFSLMIYRYVVESHAIQDVKDALMETLAGLMPDVFRNLLFGSGSGGIGLMYIALMLAGLAMAAVPLLNGATLVRLDRVIVWGVLITALFVSSGFGYDLIDSLEVIRAGMMESVSQNGGANIQQIVLSPMKADDDATQFDFSFELPQGFQEEYFPEPETRAYRVIFVDLPAIPDLRTEVDVETDESMENRRASAASGVVIALFAFLGAVLVLMFAMAYGLLDLAAIVTLLFLFAALPLGFFEFGMGVLADTLKRYVQISVVGLVVAIFMAISGTLLTHIMSGLNSPAEMGLSAMYILLTLTILRSAVTRALALAMEAGRGGYQSVQAVLTGGIAAATIATAAKITAAPQGAGKAAAQTAGRIGAGALAGAVKGALLGGGIPGAMAGAARGAIGGAVKSVRRRGNVFRDNGRVR